MSRRVSLWIGVFAMWAPVYGGACGGSRPGPSQPAPASASPPSGGSATPSASAEASSAAQAAEAPSTAPAISSVEPAAGASSSPAPARPPGPPGPGDWDRWSHDQKLAYMKSTVMPRMGDVFHDFDAKKFSEPKCTLCHGAGVQDGTFKMPNPALPKLDMTPGGMKALKSKHSKIFALMTRQVVPTMASLLGEQPYDRKTGQGFGCLECHTKK